MADKRKPTPSTNKSISIGGDVVDSTVIVGDHNTVNQTIIQKFFNIFKSDTETLEQRNRRILLGHVENAWIKGVLDASLHGAALLDLGIKQDPEAVTKYPWAIQKESTKETLPAGTSMLEIFDSIGMGRSLLILGAPGSGKTTMLLELARGLIARAREDVTYPIPMVFNLASWTEKLSLADWLAQELNNLYRVPRKDAPDWVKGNKLLLLLDGLDEVQQESRAKCVEAINAFRKEHGLTSLAVCSRSQDYADLKTKLSSEGAIEVQPLTQKQITEFFNRFGKEVAGIKQTLEKDSALREMAETPLFLSIMLMAYRGKQDVNILTSKDENTQRKHLFDTYIERMFDRSIRRAKPPFTKRQTLHYLCWLARRMILYNIVTYQAENMQPIWLDEEVPSRVYRLAVKIIFVPVWCVVLGSSLGLLFGLIGSLIGAQAGISGLILGIVIGIFYGITVSGSIIEKIGTPLGVKFPLERRDIVITIVILIFVGLMCGVTSGSFIGMLLGLKEESPVVVTVMLAIGLSFGLIMSEGAYLTQYLILRLILASYDFLPWRLISFLNFAADLIFLRRVGGGYIFVHRLLMEHFAEKYVESPTSKGN
jgi:hypothetical protein